MLSQLLVLAGVVVGALASYLTTAAAERAKWERAVDSRWDDRRVDAYATYAQALKDEISISSRITAGRGIAANPRPLPASEENLELLAAAGLKRGASWEKVLLLGHPETVEAARHWHETVWRLEGFARGAITGNIEDWEKARSEVNHARAKFYESARKDLQVRGGDLPGVVDYETRLRKIYGDWESPAHEIARRA
jgi:hypothetical protein